MAGKRPSFKTMRVVGGSSPLPMTIFSPTEDSYDVCPSILTGTAPDTISVPAKRQIDPTGTVRLTIESIQRCATKSGPLIHRSGFPRTFPFGILPLRRCGRAMRLSIIAPVWRDPAWRITPRVGLDRFRSVCQFKSNDGIHLWKSTDLKNWKPLVRVAFLGQEDNLGKNSAFHLFTYLFLPSGQIGTAPYARYPHTPALRSQRRPMDRLVAQPSENRIAQKFTWKAGGTLRPLRTRGGTQDHLFSHRYRNRLGKQRRRFYVRLRSSPLCGRGGRPFPVSLTLGGLLPLYRI